ncbi:MAG: UvrB/UvrC motif-containing protein, partial [Planctomycetota bacterium]
QVFEKPLAELFERMHGSTEHVGRTPGADPDQLALRQRLTELKKNLECAIRDEAYESAAKIRDELRQLETEPPS